MDTVKLASPWQIYYKELRAIFENDTEIFTRFDEANGNINIYCNNAKKTEALAKLLPNEKVFGNITINIIVIPANDPNIAQEEEDDENPASIWEIAFKGNSILNQVVTVNLGLYQMTYVIFQPRIVYLQTDNMSSIYGVTATLYENLATNVFENTTAQFCTAIPKQNAE